MMRVGKTLAASATLAWLFVSAAPLSAADISERAFSGENYQCPQLAPEEPAALADYEKHACADYNMETGAIGDGPVDGMETGAIGDVPVDGAEQLPDDSAINSMDATALPLALDGTDGIPNDGGGSNPPIDNGGVGNPPDTCLPSEAECLPDTEDTQGNNGVGNGVDPQPPGNPPINDGPGTAPGTPGNQGGAPSTTP